MGVILKAESSGASLKELKVFKSRALPKAKALKNFEQVIFRLNIVKLD
jgi:hypothetical protein